MISLCVPTRSRAREFREMAQSAWSTATGEVEICAWLDEDDPQAAAYLNDSRVVYGRGPRPNDTGVLTTSGLWNRAAELATGDILMMCADDVRFRTRGWDAKVAAAFASAPDRIVMVYGRDGHGNRPVLPFVSREWVEAAGHMTTPEFQGWFADEWIWAQAAELGRVVFLPDVLTEHLQGRRRDRTLQEGQNARNRVGGIAGMREKFYSQDMTRQRDAETDRLRAAMRSSARLVPEPTPAWFQESLDRNRAARVEINSDTLIVVHCYQGDAHQVESAMRLYTHHARPVLVLSPEDSPVQIEGVECQSAGKRGYYGDDSLRRQVAHLRLLLETPYTYFLLNDSDSFCLSPELPAYLYQADPDIVWSNEVREWRPHKSPYPKIGMHPPYFLTRSAIERMVAVADGIEAHPITPFIDWFMVAMVCEAGLKHKSFPDGVSFPAWKYKSIPETKQLGHDYQHTNDRHGAVDGVRRMVQEVQRGKVMLHSVKHPEVVTALEAARKQATRRDRVRAIKVGSRPAPPPMPIVGLNRVSVVVPFTSDDPARLRNWEWLQKRYAALLPEVELVVGEYDASPYSKAAAVNNGVHAATREVVIAIDADAWLAPEQLREAASNAVAFGRLVIPWSRCVRLDAAHTEEVLALDPGADLELTPEMLQRVITPSIAPLTAGTAFAITCSAFREVNGMDPRFRGWGYEDVSFRRCCDCLLGRTIYLRGDCICLWHERLSHGRERVWADQSAGMPKTSYVLSANYLRAERRARLMRQLVDEHPLEGDLQPVRDYRGGAMTVVNDNRPSPSKVLARGIKI